MDKNIPGGENMKRFLALVLAILVMATLAVPTLAAEFIHWYVPKSILLIDAQTGQVLYSKKPDKQVAPASTTKLMTALLVMENVDDLDAVVTVGKGDLKGLKKNNSKLDPVMEEGEEMSVRNLLYGMMLASGGDATCVLANYVAGSMDAFVNMMNIRAQELGMADTNFVNPHGYPEDNHYTTANDMAKLSVEVLKHDVLMQIVGTATYTIPKTNKADERVLTNTNRLITSGDNKKDFTYKYCTGMKTGSSYETGATLVASAEKGGVQLICLIFQDDSAHFEHRWQLAKELFVWAFKQYKTYGPELLQNVEVSLEEFKTYGTPSLKMDLSGVEISSMTELTSESITARVVTEGLGPATVMEGYVEYTAEDGRVLAKIPATVEIPDYVEPTEATEPSQTEPPEEDEPEEPKSSVNWFTLILGILLALAGGGVGAIWYSGYQALKKKVARIRQKIARLEEQDPESPVLPKLRKGAGAKVNFNGLYISAGLLALSIILLIVSF